MPSSRPELVPFVVNLVMQLQPRSILEIGTGFGKYGFLFREYLDIWAAAADPSRLLPENWQVRIDGIECFPAYISELQHRIYDRIISELRRQYFLAFNAGHTLTPEELEEIEIDVVRKGISVRTLLASQQTGG